MNLALLAVMIFLLGCASAVPPKPAASTSASSNESRARGNFDSDVVDCERQAAVATIGSKGEAFSNCMKSRGHVPGR